MTFLESKYKTTSILLSVELQGDEKKNLKMIFHRCNMLRQHITSIKNHFQTDAVHIAVHIATRR